MPKKHLTRKEITEDRIQFYLLEAWEWVLASRTYLLGGLGLVILLFAGYLGFQQYQARQQAAAQDQMSEALKIFNAFVPEAADQPEQQPAPPYSSSEDRDQQALRAFRSVADDNSGSEIGDLASYYVGLCQRRLGQLEDARKTLQALVDSTSTQDLRNLARNQVADISVELGDNQRAIEAWNAILDEPSTHVPTAEVMENLAKTYDKIGSHSQALELFKRLTAEHPSLPDAASIEAKIDLLENTLPPAEGSDQPAGGGNESTGHSEKESDG